MKTTTQFVLALAFLHGATQAQAQPRPITLTEAVGLAQQHSKQAKLNAADQGVAQARVQQARNRYAPSVTANLSYIRISDNIRPFTVSLPDVGPVELNPQILNQSYNNIAVRQLIWAGGSVKMGIQAAELEANAVRVEAGNISWKPPTMSPGFGKTSTCWKRPNGFCARMAACSLTVAGTSITWRSREWY